MKFSPLFLAFISSALAVPLSTISPISKTEILEKSASGLRLIHTAETENALPVWKTAEELAKLIEADVGFVSNYLKMLKARITK